MVAFLLAEVESVAYWDQMVAVQTEDVVVVLSSWQMAEVVDAREEVAVPATLHSLEEQDHEIVTLADVPFYQKK